MAGLITINGLKEGELFCRWLKNRLLVKNKNVLGANLGSTGSGKSYRDLRMAELHYKRNLNKSFPPKNICFGATQVMRRLSSGELEQGEILVVEEAGVNLGSLDFQTKISKMFTYVLQSFRSMNIAIFFNLPYLSMLNKQARMLLHYSFESAGIDFETKINKCKPFFHQVNQVTGKIYRKYPRATINGRVKTIERFNFSMPSEELVSHYERKKAQYLSNLTKEYTDELEQLERDKLAKLDRPMMTEKQLEVYNLACEGLNQTEIAKKLKKSNPAICFTLKTIKKKGYLIEKQEIAKEIN